MITNLNDISNSFAMDYFVQYSNINIFVTIIY